MNYAKTYSKGAGCKYLKCRFMKMCGGPSDYSFRCRLALLACYFKNVFFHTDKIYVLLARYMRSDGRSNFHHCLKYSFMQLSELSSTTDSPRRGQKHPSFENGSIGYPDQESGILSRLTKITPHQSTDFSL